MLLVHSWKENVRLRLKDVFKGSLLRKSLEVIKGHCGLICIMIIQYLPHWSCSPQVLRRGRGCTVYMKCFEFEFSQWDKRNPTPAQRVLFSTTKWELELDQGITLTTMCPWGTPLVWEEPSCSAHVCVWTCESACDDSCATFSGEVCISFLQAIAVNKFVFFYQFLCSEKGKRWLSLRHSNIFRPSATLICSRVALSGIL